MNLRRMTIGLIFISSIAFAQGGFNPNDPSKADLDTLTRNGQLFSVKIIPKKRMQIYVAGIPEGNYNFQTGKVDVRILKPLPEDLDVTQVQDHYVISKNIPRDQDVDVEVQPHSNGKTEVFHFKIKSQASEDSEGSD